MASNGDQEDFLLDDSNELLATTEDASDSLLGTDTPDAQEDANFPEGGEEAEAEAAGTDDADATGAGDEAEADPELEEIRARVAEMEAEAEKLKEMHMEVEKQMSIGGSSTTSSFSASTSLNLNQSLEDKMEADARSIYIGNVDYGSTAEELEAHFHGCGSINRVTIQCDKFTGHPKGFAYIEFADKDSVVTATALDDSLFRGRQIKVVPKRTNRPGISSTNRPPRGRGRGRGRSSYYYGSRGYRPYSRRPRRSNWYSPY